MWYRECLTEKQDRAVIKLRCKDGTFWKSIIVPTDKYPLTGDYKVYHCDNTKEVTDTKVLEIFDRHKFKAGHCYHNTEILSDDLRQEGYDAETYAGWLFVADTELPVHHCWTVLDGIHVLDPADFFTAMFSSSNIGNFKETQGYSDTLDIMGSFIQAAKEELNHLVCAPVGITSDILLYVGAKCKPMQARTVYQNLLRRYPDHECDRTNSRGINMTQEIMLHRGIFEL